MASKINADEFVDREGEGKPTLPQGVVLSGVTTITTAVVDGNEVANSTGINVGIITSTHFAGNLTGDVNAGIVTVTSQTVIGSAVTISSQGIDIGAGVITATSYAGGGGNLTGIGATIMVWEYNPDPYLTGLPFDIGIGITFNQKIKAGSGNITLSIANAGVAGTVVENFGIGNSVTITGNSLSINPTSDLSVAKDYIITYPSGVITNMAGESYVGTAYTFQTRSYSYELWGAGNNNNGHIGIDNGPGEFSSPVQIPGTNWSVTSGGGGAKFWGSNIGFIKTDGTLWTWGDGSNGALGHNNTTTYSSPRQVPGTTWATFKPGRIFSMATKTDGTLWMWGNNQGGQFGQNNKTEYSSPVQIPGTTWSTSYYGIATGATHVAAVKTDGTLWSWGNNQNGQCAQNTNDNNTNFYSSPVQIPGSTWRGIVSGAHQEYGLKTDGTLWAWGYNATGRLGQNNTAEYSSPVQIPGTTWKDIRGNTSPLATKTDGTLWAWGSNTYGILGLNQSTPTKYSSPIQIPGTTWNEIGQSGREDLMNQYATKTDGTLWTWGGNRGGISAVNTNGDHHRLSSPTQIPGTDWYSIPQGGDNFQYFFKRI